MTEQTRTQRIEELRKRISDRYTSELDSLERSYNRMRFVGGVISGVVGLASLGLIIYGVATNNDSPSYLGLAGSNLAAWGFIYGNDNKWLRRIHKRAEELEEKIDKLNRNSER